jgi:hypothetical protein
MSRQMSGLHGQGVVQVRGAVVGSVTRQLLVTDRRSYVASPVSIPDKSRMET